MGKWCDKLNAIEDALFDIHHGTPGEIANRAKLHNADTADKFLQVLVIFGKATKRIEGDQAIYTIIEESWESD